MFDHSGQLYLAAQQSSFDAKFGRLMQDRYGVIKNHILHFTDEQCWCQFVAAPHIASVQSLAQAQGLTNVSISKHQLNTEERKYVPSYPAVALFNENGKLAYLGPYSSGIYCRKGQGLIEPFIRNILMSPPLAALPFDAQGCYCKA